MTSPVFKNVTYINPWAPLPPTYFRSGVIVTTVSTDPAHVLAARLRIIDKVLQVIVNTVPSNQVSIVPVEPLSATSAYSIDVQLVQPNTSPDNIHWDDTTLTSTAPVMTSTASLLRGQVESGNLLVDWEYAPAALKAPGSIVRIFKDGSSLGYVQINGNRASLPFNPIAGDNYTLNIQSLMPIIPLDNTSTSDPSTWGPISYGPIDYSTVLPGIAMPITSITTTRNLIFAEWAAPIIPSEGVSSIEYELIVSDGASKAFVSAGATGGQYVISDTQKIADLTLSTRLIINGIKGPVSSPVDVFTSIANLGYVTDPISGAMTLKWDAVGDATSYYVSVNGAAPILVSSNEYSLPNNPKYGDKLYFTVSAVKENATLKLSAPESLPLNISTDPITITDVFYNGINITLKWRDQGSYSGYVISVYKQGGIGPLTTCPVGGGVYESTFPSGIDLSKIDPSQNYLVTIQGNDNNSSGIATQAQNIFTAGFYVSAKQSSITPPFLYPATNLALIASTTLGTSGNPITLFLPDIGVQSSSLPINSAATNAAFTVQKTTPDNPVYPCQLVMTATSPVWNFPVNSSIRSDLYSQYVTLLKNLEAAGAKPWGIMTVQQAIGRYMPQTFQEALLYNYGLNFPNVSAGINYCSFDLMPGMVLRVITDNYLAVASSSAEFLNGYINNCVTDYEIGSCYNNQTWLQGFDSFINQLVANGALSISSPLFDFGEQRESGIADSADLYFSGFWKPFYRVFVPSKLYSPSSAGTTVTPSNFVIAAAGSYTNLSTSTNVPSSEAFALAYFGGRSILKAYIRVYVNDECRLVPIGTTLQNILESLGRSVPYAPNALSGVTLTRGLGSVVLDSTPPYQIQNSYDVRLDWGNLPIYASGYTALAVPLLHGDQIKLG